MANTSSAGHEVRSEGIVKHPKFFFDNTLVVIQIEDVRFNVHRYQLLKSETFADMFTVAEQSGGDVPAEGSSTDNPIKMEGVSAHDFECLLTVLYASFFSTRQPEPEASLIIPAFRLANMWNFSDLREHLVPLAERVLGDTAKIAFAREFNIDQWIAPAYARLCQRKEPLDSEEAKTIGLEGVLFISRIREGRYTKNPRYPKRPSIQHSMSASDLVPSRSSTGCLTCKKRRKKCDEKRPICDRCLLGRFECQGYAHLEAASGSAPRRGNREATQSVGTASSLTQGSLSPALGSLLSCSDNQSSSSIAAPDGSFSSLFSGLDNSEELNHPLPITPFELGSIPRNPELDPFDLDNMKQLIVIQCTRLARRISFRPYPYPVELGLAKYLLRGSNLIHKTLYLGARISQALFDDTNWQGYIGWIDTFHHRILEAQSSLVTVNTELLADRLASHCRLATFAFMVSNSSVGYAIFRKGVSPFLELAATFPKLWKGDSAISLSHALHLSRHELARFVIMDTIAALAFGIAPLVHYDTTIQDHNPDRFHFVEQVYACPVIVLMALARVNQSRASRLMGQDTITPEDVEAYESAVRNWKPGVDYTDSPSQLVARLAVQESWRQAALIYLYMGMRESSSTDSRVEPLVRQVAQLASTVEAGSPFDTHLFIPCLIAGVAARKEKHRAIFRKKIQVSQKTDASLLRGADFSLVLDHLWHGAAAGGNPVTWDDYASSRALTLPVSMDA
ncbi:unnamed protein product [Rhizoctonia solani]|uniref:Zn(2)-C6 fungal-type domain-containing protein n=1 Tax=Rhizoctonia solani TaxID=456999 RepID=A0A8H3C9T4_9AGAM|nr:unnamed protein product [Rhizoctonia solani]